MATAFKPEPEIRAADLKRRGDAVWNDLREFNAAHPVLHRAQIDRAKYRRPSFTVPTEDRGSVWVRNFAFLLSAATTLLFVGQLVRWAF